MFLQLVGIVENHQRRGRGPEDAAHRLARVLLRAVGRADPESSRARLSLLRSVGLGDSPTYDELRLFATGGVLGQILRAPGPVEDPDSDEHALFIRSQQMLFDPKIWERVFAVMRRMDLHPRHYSIGVAEAGAVQVIVTVGGK